MEREELAFVEELVGGGGGFARGESNGEFEIGGRGGVGRGGREGLAVGFSVVLGGSPPHCGGYMIGQLD